MRSVVVKLSRDRIVNSASITPSGALADITKEEDFVANLYNRNLLTEFEAADISNKIEDAITYVESDSCAITNRTLRDGLLNRLELRRKLLCAVQLDDVVDGQRATLWECCLALLPTLSQTTKLGKPVSESISIKIQRRLASSAPPRPIINISFDDAFAQLNRLCQNARDAYRILDYHGGSHLLVSTCITLFESIQA